MKFLPVIWAGLWRRPVRTVFTALSVLIAFLLFGALFGITSGIDAVIGDMSPNGMRVQARSSFGDALPVSYLERINAVPGVKSAISLTFMFDAYFQDPKARVPAAAYGGENPFDSLPPQFTLPSEQAEALLRTRNGAVIGARLAERFGWKIGDRVPLTSNTWPRRDGSSLWTFDIVGIYEWKGQPEIASELLFNYDYLEEARAAGNGVVTFFMLRVKDASRAAQVGTAIDDMFANSTYPTLTQNDRDWVRARVDQIGNIEFFVTGIIGAALFTLLFLTGNTMTQSVMERIPELAVLKALGFSNPHVCVMVLLEAALLCLSGAAAGLAAAALLFPRLSGLLQLPISLPWSSVLVGLGMALLVAVLSAAFPVLRARRLTVIEGLARR